MTDRFPDTIDDLRTPALVVDLDILESNLSKMAQRADALGVALRPHIKTHKCVEIGKRQLAHGAAGITVSTVYEAEVFADHGFDDIVWAFPFVHDRVEDAIALARRIRLGVTVDTLDAVRVLARAGFPFEVHLKVDCGYHRAGVDPTSEYALDVARAIADAAPLRLTGILSHSGHAYGRNDRSSVARVAEEERTVMVDFAARLREEGLDIQTISVGSTPAMTAVETLEGVTEARPGNYAFFDYSQVVFGSCAPRDCAVTVVSSVVSSQPGGDHSIVDAGALALSKDASPKNADFPSMGRVFADYGTGRLEPDLHLVSLSQEHGRLNQVLAPGSRVRILPNHSCLAVAQFDRMYVSRDDEITDAWTIWRGRR